MGVILVLNWANPLNTVITKTSVHKNTVLNSSIHLTECSNTEEPEFGWPTTDLPVRSQLSDLAHSSGSWRMCCQPLSAYVCGHKASSCRAGQRVQSPTWGRLAGDCRSGWKTRCWGVQTCHSHLWIIQCTTSKKREKNVWFEWNARVIYLFYLPYSVGVHSACPWSYRCPNSCGCPITLRGASGPAGWRRRSEREAWATWLVKSSGWINVLVDSGSLKRLWAQNSWWCS